MIGGCAGTRYGCCLDGVTPKIDYYGSNCNLQNNASTTNSNFSASDHVTNTISHPASHTTTSSNNLSLSTPQKTIVNPTQAPLPATKSKTKTVSTPASSA
jgi:hypothetical protein